jgi:MFS family permease
MNEMYFKLSLLMFFEYAIWGAWLPVLAARLLGPLKMNGKQTGWIYATLPIASMISPPIVGYIADNLCDARWLLLGCHLLGAILLFVSAKLKRFWPLFLVMFLYSLLYGATIPLVNTVMFRNLGDINVAYIFIWAPVAWALIGYILTGLRSLKSEEGDGSDCLKLAAILSLIMVVVCLFQPATVPQVSESNLTILDLLKDNAMLLFLIVSAAIAGMQQFYFLGTAQFMQNNGMSSKRVPLAMASAQIAQAVATLFLLSYFFTKCPGPKWTLVIGAVCWLVLFNIYTFFQKPGAIVAIQPFHGFAYVFFIFGGQMFANKMVGPEMVASGQALIMWATNGIGLFLGAQIAGVVMDRNSVEGQFNWKGIFKVPLVIIFVGTLILIFLIQDPVAPKAEAATGESEVVIEKVETTGDGATIEALTIEKKEAPAKSE